MTTLTIAIICGVILLAFLGLACMVRRAASNPVEEMRPVSWPHEEGR